jgi:2-polyprenyl-3-methyl-5-hydroxy-6-metoxy-1,4-benzoquinol methylase
MVDEWEEYAAGWDGDEAARAYANAAFGSLNEVTAGAGPKLAAATVIDFGCGTGLLTEQLVEVGATVTAVDTSPAMLAVLEAKIADRRWTTVTTTTNLDDAPAGNDLIVCSSVCSFLDDYQATATTLAGLLRPGGLFIQWDWEREGDDEHGLSRHEITDALTQAGLQQIEVATAFEVPMGDQIMRPLVGHGRRPTT